MLTEDLLFVKQYGNHFIYTSVLQPSPNPTDYTKNNLFELIKMFSYAAEPKEKDQNLFLYIGNQLVENIIAGHLGGSVS